MKEKILLFDQWGINFCEGLLDIKDYTQERRPEDIFYRIVKSTRLFEFIENFKVVLDDNGLAYQVSTIDN